MADFIGDFVSAACDIAHELKVAVGTGFTILGSKLEADERARVDASALCVGCGHARVDHVELVGGCGKRMGPERVPCPCRGFVESVGAQWLTEFENQRDVWEPFECAVYPECDGQCCHHQDSAAVSAAADPSPADSFTVPRAVGDEGPGPDSVIPKTVGSGQPSKCRVCSAGEMGQRLHKCPDSKYYIPGSDPGAELIPAPMVVAGESPGEADEQPSLGELADSEFLTVVSERITAETRYDYALIAELRARAHQFAVLESVEAEK